MTGFSIERTPFDDAEIRRLNDTAGRYANWPVVYTLSSDRQVYVGESLNVANRMKQHRDSGSKHGLTSMRIVLDDTFNKSVCLDLESFLIRLFAGDGLLEVLNRNSGITDSAYFDRTTYRQTFREVFESLRREELFTRSIPEIENSDLFKLSPFKNLNHDQAVAIEDIVEGLLDDLRLPDVSSTIVVQGSAGTGKTIVGIYLMKLLRDIADSVEDDEPDHDSMFSEFFVPENRTMLSESRIAMIVPQQSLRKSIQRVFKKTPGLKQTDVLSPFEFGKRGIRYDVVVVDEAHRLNHRANQPSAAGNTAYRNINIALFGEDRDELTQLDWILKLSSHQLFLLDEEQSVGPADLPPRTVGELVARAKSRQRYFPLRSQMRVRAGSDYIAYIRDLLSGRASDTRPDFGEYDFRFFDDPAAMHQAIRMLDERVGLARLVAGFAWPWRSKTDRSAYDIEIAGYRLRWNQTDKDWINSPAAIDEVGSIHTVQGYDLNYAGVIIGPDLQYDSERDAIVFDRSNYRDARGKQDNHRLGLRYSDDDLLVYVQNIYSVLLTRGMLGTFLYVCDPALREYLRERVPIRIGS
jgi:DUF2075 family protein